MFVLKPNGSPTPRSMTMILACITRAVCPVLFYSRRDSAPQQTEGEEPAAACSARRRRSAPGPSELKTFVWPLFLDQVSPYIACFVIISTLIGTARQSSSTATTTFGSSPSLTRAVAVQRPTEARRVTLRARAYVRCSAGPNRSAQGTAWPPNRTGRWVVVSSSVTCWSAAPRVKRRRDPRGPC